jgi:hypothetical protein
MNRDMSTWNLKEHLLKMKQTHAHVSDLPNKPTIGDKIEQLGFQKVGPKSGQLGVTRCKSFVVLSGIGKCWSQHLLLHLGE